MLITVLLLSIFVVFPALCIFALCKTSARADQREATIQANLDGERQRARRAPLTGANNRLSGELMRQLR